MFQLCLDGFLGLNQYLAEDKVSSSRTQCSASGEDLTKMCSMKVVEENKRQLLQKVLSLWCKQLFAYIDGNFAINWIRPNFLSHLLKSKIHRGMKERVGLKKITSSGNDDICRDMKFPTMWYVR